MAGEAAFVLPDVLAHDLTVLFCGSAAGRASAAASAYYAGPGNRFWPALHKVGLTPRLLRPAEFPLLLDYGLGLTDICKTAAGADHELPAEHDDAAALCRKIEHYRPQILAFVGKRAAQVTLGAEVSYGLQAEPLGPAGVFVLPSPSGAARRYWDERPWRQLAALAS